MASRKEHCKECKEKLGKPFNEVHKWLDGCATVILEGIAYLDINHRRHRHHKEGLEEIRKIFGEDAYIAGKLHILSDFGYIPSVSEYKGQTTELIKWETIKRDWKENK